MVGLDFWENVLENFYLRKTSKKSEIFPIFGRIIFENELPCLASTHALSKTQGNCKI